MGSCWKIIVGVIILVHKDIVAIGKTLLWNKMISNTTVDTICLKDVSMKYTGHEKFRVSDFLTGKLDQTKCKPFIVLARAKRYSKALHEEFQ